MNLKYSASALIICAFLAATQQAGGQGLPVDLGGTVDRALDGQIIDRIEQGVEDRVSRTVEAIDLPALPGEIASGALEGLDLVPFDAGFDLARAVKSEAELDSVRESVAINDDGFEAFLAAYEPGKTAAEVMAPAEELFVERGCGRLDDRADDLDIGLRAGREEAAPRRVPGFRSSVTAAAFSETSFGNQTALATQQLQCRFRFEVPDRVRCDRCRNFKSAALGASGRGVPMRRRSAIR